MDHIKLIEETALRLLADGEFHDLTHELDAFFVVELELCRQRCEALGKEYKNVRSIRKHGKRLLIQDALEALPSDRVVRKDSGGVTLYKKFSP